VRSFPQNLTAKLFGFAVKPNFTVGNEAQIATAPVVDFGSGVGAQARQGEQSPPAAPAPATTH
jgi:LemA protein